MQHHFYLLLLLRSKSLRLAHLQQGEESGMCLRIGGMAKNLCLLPGISGSASPASHGPGFMQASSSCLMGTLVWKWGPGSSTKNTCYRDITTSSVQTVPPFEWAAVANSSSVIKMGQPLKWKNILKFYSDTQMIILSLVKHLEWAGYYSEDFLDISRFNPHHRGRSIPLLFSFYGWGDWGPKRLNSLSKFTWLVSGRTKIGSSASGTITCVLSHTPVLLF